MRRTHGFTLIELLAALFALALLAVMSWRGLDGMVRARQVTEARADEVLTLQTGLAQWAADLDAIEVYQQIKPLEWNGRVLRLTRRDTVDPAAGARVVAWTRREGQWRRWQSEPLVTRGDMENALRIADQWSQNPGDSLRAQEVAVVPLEDWQVFFYQCNSWTNPQSNQQGCAPAGAVGVGLLPEGVRVILQLPTARAIGGTLTRDWARVK